jgi:hypothetical protein
LHYQTPCHPTANAVECPASQVIVCSTFPAILLGLARKSWKKPPVNETLGNLSCHSARIVQMWMLAWVGSVAGSWSCPRQEVDNE